MISFITNLLRTVLIAFFLNGYLKRKYPKQYDDLLVSVSFNTIYMFSVIQIKIKNAQKYLYMTNPRIAELLEIYGRGQNKNNIDYVLDGKIIYSTSNVSLKTDQLLLDKDFIIYSDYACQDINKKIMDNLDDFDCEKSDVKFMLVELKIGENIYKIDFKTDSFNFYLSGNCFTKKFFLYYLDEILKSREQVDSDNKWSLKIIDHNVDTIEMEFTDKNESILLVKTDYKLLNLNTENNTNNIENKEKE